jgi:hypothetical protein
MILTLLATKGTTDSVYIADDGKSPGQSRGPPVSAAAATAAGAPMAPAVAQPSPRETSGGKSILFF